MDFTKVIRFITYHPTSGSDFIPFIAGRGPPCKICLETCGYSSVAQLQLPKHSMCGIFTYMNGQSSW